MASSSSTTSTRAMLPSQRSLNAYGERFERFRSRYMHKACRNDGLLLPFLHNTRKLVQIPWMLARVKWAWRARSCGLDRSGTADYCVISTSLGYFSPGIVAMTVLVLASMAEMVSP